MSFWGIFKKNKSSDETREAIFYKLIAKYFDGSLEKLSEDANELLALTKFDITQEEMKVLLVRCVGFREINAEWSTNKVADALKRDCSGKLSDYELKWLLVYCDIHYILKDSDNEIVIICELAGRQIGLPSPLGDISSNYQFKK